MFIRTVIKKSGSNEKTYECHQLVESVRTEKGVRQRLLLSLGRLTLEKSKWPRLVRRIKEIIQGQTVFFQETAEIEMLAAKFAHRYMEKHALEADVAPIQPVNMNTLENHHVRTIGAEHLGVSFFKELGLPGCLKRCGLTKRQIEIAMLLVIGRLVHPGSERHLFHWAQHLSGLDELIDSDFSRLSLNSLYKVTDVLFEHKTVIESHLRARENTLFSLKETIILYDLTNTYFEGQASGNGKARFGRSKEKRSDCRLLTLGLVVDGQGFPKTSQVFSGSQSEPETLLDMVNTLHQQDPTEHKKPTVVIDAGIATEENLKALKKHYHYIAVSRKKFDMPTDDDYIVIKQTTNNTVEAKRIVDDNEVVLYCKSALKSKKEKSMQSRQQHQFEDQLSYLAKSIRKKGCTKRYDKVLERIGRLKERYKPISRFYQIDVEERNGLAIRIRWQYLKEQSDKRYSGGYFLRTDRKDLSEKEIWAIYVMLTQLEAAFRSLKSDLLLRPVFHQKENRSDAHIFITVLAYHLLHSMRTRLKQRDIHHSWATIRDRMATHCRVTNRIQTEKKDVLFIRKCSQPESFHKMIYKALELTETPCQTKKKLFKICSDP
jgi:transposase